MTEPGVFRFTAPWPPAASSPNARGSWRKRWRAESGHRGYKAAVAAAIREAAPEPGVLPHFGRARLDLEFVVPDRRRRDVDNLSAAAVKALIDTIVALGLLPDDSAAYLEMGGPTIRLERGQKCVRVTLWEVASAQKELHSRDDT